MKLKSKKQFFSFFILFLSSVGLYFLLRFNGGAHNPFAILYVFLAFVAAMRLSFVYYCLITGISLLFLSLIYSPLTDSHIHMALDYNFHLQGMWLANSLAVVFGSGWVFYLRIQKEKIEKKHDEVQKMLTHLEKMDSMGRMMATTSHKLNTSLGTLQLGLSELKDQPLDKNTVDEWYEDLQKAIDDMSEVICQMKSEPEIEASNEKVNLNNFLELTLNHWSKPRKAESSFKSDGAEIMCSLSNAKLLRDCVLALLDNSYQAYSIKQTKIINVELLKPDKNLKIKVQDFGSGISMNIRKKVIEPLFTTKAQGTGLGLYYCYQTTKKFGGFVDIHSEINQGSIVTLNFNYEKIAHH